MRYSLQNPHAYIDANIVGFTNILEGCRHGGVKHLVFASSSSVYGANTRMPFSVHDNVDHPVSLYAATKKANELMAHTYSHLYGLPCTGLRFFTVYGPWGRPDMALFLFTDAILKGRPIQVFNHGRMQRDFTYIDDIVEGVVRVMGRLPAPNPAWSGDAPGPGHVVRPVPRLQHRQQPAGRAQRVHRDDRGCARGQGREGIPGHAARGCAGDLRGCGRSHGRRRFQAGDPHPRGDRALHSLVPGLLPDFLKPAGNVPFWVDSNFRFPL